MKAISIERQREILGVLNTDRATTVGTWALKLGGWTDEMMLFVGITPPEVELEERDGQ